MNRISYKDALGRLDVMYDDVPDWWDDPLCIDLSYVVIDQMYDILAVGDEISGDPIQDIQNFWDILEDRKQENGPFSYLFGIYSDVVYTFLHTYLIEDDGLDILEGWNVPHE